MLPYFQVLLCAFFWGLCGPIIRWSELSPESVIAVRSCVPLFTAYTWIKWVEKRRLVFLSRPLLIVSVLMLTANILYITAFSFTSIANVLLILYTRPAMTTLMAAWILREHVGLRLWLLLAICMSGVITIMSEHGLHAGDNDAIGLVMTFVAAICTGLGWTLIKRYGYERYSVGEILFYQHIVGAVIFFPLFCQTLYSAPIHSLAIISLYPMISGFLGSTFYFSALKHIAISKVMPLTYIELLVAVICGILFFHEELTIRMVIGGSLILIAATGTIFMPKSKVVTLPPE